MDADMSWLPTAAAAAHHLIANGINPYTDDEGGDSGPYIGIRVSDLQSYTVGPGADGAAGAWSWDHDVDAVAVDGGEPLRQPETGLPVLGATTDAAGIAAAIRTLVDQPVRTPTDPARVQRVIDGLLRKAASVSQTFPEEAQLLEAKAIQLRRRYGLWPA